MNKTKELDIPDTKLVEEATELVREVASTSIFNHSVRSYVFASALGKKTNRKYDKELLYLAAIMHDLGIVEKYIGTSRFEIDGADAATKFLNERSYPAEKSSLIWDAIALHTSMEIPDRKQPEVALLHVGVFLDVGGYQAEQLPVEFLNEIFSIYPRLGFREEFYKAFAEVIRRKPHTAYLSFEADIAHRYVHGYNPPNICDIAYHHPFAE
jgi:hypothetical protein